MQQLFSQQLRFKNDDGLDFPDWEEKQMKEIMDIRNEQAPKSKEYPLMAFIKNIGVAPKGDRYNREFLVKNDNGKKYKKTDFGDFIYSSNNLDTGSIGLNNYGSASISPVYSIFQIKELCDYKFINSFLIRKSFINEMIRFRQGVMYGQWRIHESDVLKIKEKIPCYQEQQKIANYLSAIDKKIENVQTQIAKSQAFKKGLLQQMFV
jgi:type I restriction enzyme S subunit